MLMTPPPWQRSSQTMQIKSWEMGQQHVDGQHCSDGGVIASPAWSRGAELLSRSVLYGR
jgi:hypothetical protein